MQIFGPSLGADPVADALAAEKAGFHGVRVLDHLFHKLPGLDMQRTEHPFVALGAAAAVTSRVLLTQTVLDVSRRHPAEVCQALATLDRVSNGRAELGLGTGWFEPAHTAVGIELGPPRDRVDRLVDAMAICRSMLDNLGRVSYQGRFFQAEIDVPWAATPHPIEMLVGAARPRLLRLATEWADWIELLSPPQLEADDEGTLDLDAVLRRVADGRAMAAAGGRSVKWSVRIEVQLEGPARPRNALRAGGGEDAVIDLFEALAAGGVRRFVILPFGSPTRDWLYANAAALGRIMPLADDAAPVSPGRVTA